MKVGGKVIDKPNELILAIPRENEDIIFKVRAVLDMDEFDKLCPEPVPPTIVNARTQEKRLDYKDKKYMEKAEKHSRQRFDYLVLKSLEATDGLEWDTVKMDDPETWQNWEQDMKNAFFSIAELQRIRLAVFDANSLNEEKLKEARDRFTRSQAAAKSEQSSQKEEHSSMESGEPASVSA